MQDRQYTSHKPKKTQSNQPPLSQQGDHIARQDPHKTTVNNELGPVVWN